MGQVKELKYDEQLDLLESRGMIVSNDARVQPTKMETIGYYKIKEFAQPFFKDSDYDGVHLQNIIKRYYLDKNMRMHILHAIEKIEVSLKVKVAYYFGEKYGAYGYLAFNNWYNQNNCTVETMNHRERKFKDKLKKSVSRSNNFDVKNSSNLNDEGLPTVWLGVNLLMFGDFEFLIKNMNRSALIWLAKEYELNNYKELLSMIGLIHFVRNICCHNGNLIDIKFRRIPAIRDEWKPLLYQYESEIGETYYSNHLAVAVLVIKYLVD